ncbi:hypothetical protein DdX_08996 [Ditylenchus destructor]|uniref:Uncharacterized protein n=1 Tax=Ditylenchus destructor TaxID=166010 RepID=A0AAD4N1N8_9BILA|nr:hypothetical protein DdX_08996 [Ditylenchus destructor]
MALSEYRLSRTRSAAIVRSSSIDSRPTVLLTRTYSVPDVSAYIRASNRYKPQWPSYSTYSWRYGYGWPYRYYRDYSLYDDYWYDRYTYFSPLYYSSLFPRRYYHSDYLPNPYYSSYASNYWTRYKGYLYDYDTPYYYRRYVSPYYDSYLSSIYNPYRSYLLSSMNDSLINGLELYRKGIINFSVLNHSWLSANYWDKSFKDMGLLYYSAWDKKPVASLQQHYSNRAKQYITNWSETQSTA